MDMTVSTSYSSFSVVTIFMQKCCVTLLVQEPRAPSPLYKLSSCIREQYTLPCRYTLDPFWLRFVQKA